MVFMALMPIISNTVRKDASIPVERAARNRAASGRHHLQSRLGVLVPKVEGPVRPRSGECAVRGVEGYVVDREDVVFVVSVTFEGEVISGILVFDILDTHTAFDRTNGKPSVVVEASNNTRLPFERRQYLL